MTRDGGVKAELAGRRRPGAWVGYTACACAWLFAVPSFYWAGGGKVGADTIGRQAVEYSWGTDPLAMTIVLATAGLKVLTGLLSLALVRPWGQRSRSERAGSPGPRRISLKITRLVGPADQARPCMPNSE